MKIRKIFLLIFLLCINLFARNTIDLSTYKEKTALKKAETYYFPNVTNSCEVFGRNMNISKTTYSQFLSMLNLYETNEEKVFVIANYFLAKLVSNYNVITTKNICQITMIEDKGYPKYIFLYPKSEFRKLKNRDFGKNDKKMIKIANESKHNNYNLPYPLIKTFKNIKVGNWDKNTNFIVNKKATSNYIKFLDKFQFPDFAISMDENSVEDAYMEKEALNEYGKYVTEKYIKKLDMLRKKHNKEMCDIFIGDLPVYYACRGDIDALGGIGGKYAWIAQHVIENKCDYVSGSDTNGLYQVCEYKRDGCSSLKYSQKVINACFSCNGSNRWLRMFAASLINGKTLPKCY